jgi:hypothetical protein
MLEKIGGKHGWSGVHYFLYNPTLASFDPASAKAIRAFENRILDSEIARGLTHAWDDEYGLYGLPGPHVFKLDFLTDAAGVRKHFAEQVAMRPGLKVLAVATVKSIGEEGPLNLAACYRAGDEASLRGQNTTIPFLSFATFIVDLFMSCSRGTTDEGLRRLAAGQAPDGSDDGGREHAARHTLTITLRSDLPSVDQLHAEG